MSLLPIYYNSNRLTPKRRKKKNVSEKELRLIQAHEKFLKRMGIDPNYKRKPAPLKLGWKSEQLPSRDIKDYDWKIQTKKDAKKYHGNVILGQAYNKGNLVVLSGKEASDASTGKRR